MADQDQPSTGPTADEKAGVIGQSPEPTSMTEEKTSEEIVCTSGLSETKRPDACVEKLDGATVEVGLSLPLITPLVQPGHVRSCLCSRPADLASLRN